MAQRRGADIFERAIINYKENPVLIVPPSLLFVVTLLFEYSLAQLMHPNSIPEAGIAFAIEGCFLLLIGALWDAGLASMSASVVTKGKCTLSDWLIGIKRYSWRIIGITIMLTILTVILQVVLTMENVFFPNLPFYCLNQAGAWVCFLSEIVPRLYTVITSSVLLLLQYLAYGAVTIDNRKFWSSIRAGFRAASASRKIFLSLLILYCIYSEILHVFNAYFVSPASSYAAIFASSFTLPSIVTSIIGVILAPVWMLITFVIYSDFSQKAKKSLDPVQGL